MSKTITLGYRPRPAMVPYHAALSRGMKRAIIVAHRRFGKTVGCVRQLERSALECKYPRGRFGYIAPLYSQAKQIAWEYAKEGAYVLKMNGIKCKVNESELRIVYPNGAELKLYGADNPDQLRGLYWNGVVLDEIADMRPDLFEVVINPGLQDYDGWATLIGTPKGRDRFYEYWRRATTSEREVWYSAMHKASETGILSPEYLKKAREEMSEGDYNREFECSFDEASSSQLISGIEVQRAKERQGFGDGVRTVGVDVARFGDDRTCIVFRKGDKIVDINVYSGMDTMQVVGRVMEAITSFKPDATFVDVGGLGAGVVDRLRQLRYNVFDVNASSKPRDAARFHNLRAEMWWTMREWIRTVGVLPDNQMLADDLTAITYFYDAGNRIQLEKKEDMKKRGLPSPDLADALALTFAYPVAMESLTGKRADRGGDYDPFNPYGEDRRRASRADDYDPYRVP